MNINNKRELKCTSDRHFKKQKTSPSESEDEQMSERDEMMEEESSSISETSNHDGTMIVRNDKELRNIRLGHEVEASIENNFRTFRNSLDSLQTAITTSSNEQKEILTNIMKEQIKHFEALAKQEEKTQERIAKHFEDSKTREGAREHRLRGQFQEVLEAIKDLRNENITKEFMRITVLVFIILILGVLGFIGFDWYQRSSYPTVIISTHEAHPKYPSSHEPVLTHTTPSYDSHNQHKTIPVIFNSNIATKAQHTVLKELVNVGEEFHYEEFSYQKSSNGNSPISFYVFSTAGTSRSGERDSFPSIDYLKRDFNSSNIIIMLIEYDPTDRVFVPEGSGIRVGNILNNFQLKFKLNIMDEIKNPDEIKPSLKNILEATRKLYSNT